MLHINHLATRLKDESMKKKINEVTIEKPFGMSWKNLTINGKFLFNGVPDYILSVKISAEMIKPSAVTTF